MFTYAEVAVLHARSNIGKGLQFEKHPDKQYGVGEFQSALTELRSVRAKPELVNVAFGKLFSSLKKLGSSDEYVFD